MLLIVLTELKAQGIDKIDNKCSTLVFFPHADSCIQKTTLILFGRYNVVFPFLIDSLAAAYIYLNSM